MPELPEVETVVRTLRPQIVGQTIKNMEILLPKALAFGEEYLPHIVGLPITRVWRRAKVILVGLGEAGKQAPLKEDDAFCMAFHLKMTGSFFMHPLGTPPMRHTRLIFDLGDGRLFFDDIRTFGYCRIMRADDFSAWPFWQKLGPEPLETSSLALARRLKAKNTTIKGALLDQSVVVGVGNIYADESLFQAGISPLTKASEVSLKRLTRLGDALKEVLQVSIDECGSSIRNYTDAFGNAGSFQNNFMVYGRKGKPCKICHRPLLGETVAARTTVYCPHCQKK